MSALSIRDPSGILCWPLGIIGLALGGGIPLGIGLAGGLAFNYFLPLGFSMIRNDRTVERGISIMSQMLPVIP